MRLITLHSINNIDAFNLPKLTFEPQNGSINITIKNKYLKGIIALAQIFQQKGIIYINECIEMINYMAKTINLKLIAISVFDPIFNRGTVAKTR